MPDTPRNRSAILSLFADNSTRAISEQDLRDFTVSAYGVYGGLIADNISAATTVNNVAYKSLTSGTYESATNLAGGVTVNATTGRITVPVTGDYDVWYQFSIASATTCIMVHALHVNGTLVVPEVQSKVTVSGGTNFGFIACAKSIVPITAGQYISIRGKGSVASASVSHFTSQFNVRLLG